MRLVGRVAVATILWVESAPLARRLRLPDGCDAKVYTPKSRLSPRGWVAWSNVQGRPFSAEGWAWTEVGARRKIRRAWRKAMA